MGIIEIIFTAAMIVVVLVVRIVLNGSMTRMEERRDLIRSFTSRFQGAEATTSAETAIKDLEDQLVLNDEVGPTQDKQHATDEASTFSKYGIGSGSDGWYNPG